MQTYPVKASHRSQLSAEALRAHLNECFGVASVEGDTATSQFGAIDRIRARAEGKNLRIEVQMNPKVDGETASETIRRYNRFLEAATGFNAKERARRLRKSAGSGE